MCKREEFAEVAWDKNAAGWDERSADLWEKGNRQTIIPYIKEHLAPGSTILDIGSGNGYGTFKLKEAGYDAAGTDFSAAMVKIAQTHYKDEAIPFRQADISNMPQIATGVFDAAMIINVFEWTSNPQQALQEAGRVIRRSGLLFVGILGPTAGPRAYEYKKVYGEPVIMNSMMPWEFMQLAEEQGFHIVEHYGIYRREVKEKELPSLPLKLKQALSFMWIFTLKKK